MNDADTGRRVIDGRFRLEARLGGGGMGTVWRATDLALHRSVAVKEVRPPDPALAEYDPDGARLLRERVLREARALARIDHPNVVTIHHIVDGGEGTYPWIVMELVGGGSLADLLNRGPMDPAGAARTGREVLAALSAAHEAGIHHRDVKPANVLLRPDGRPVLTDFGIAAILDSTALTATGSIIGTPDYMAPERISGQDAGAASDLWSLAMMLYAAVEGHHPLRRGTTLATLAAVLHDEVPPPERAGPLGDVLMGVLVRDAVARPDAGTLDRMLAAVVDGDGEPTSYRLAPPPADVPPVSPTGPGGSPTPVAAPSGPSGRAGRSRWLVVALSVAGTVLTGVLVWWFLPGGDGGTGATPSKSSQGSNDAQGSEDSGGGTSGKPSTTPTPRRTDGAKEDGAQEEGPTGLLTPDGVRTAIRALEKESGGDRFGRFVVYPDYVMAHVMVEGSETKYDSYTYRVGRGVEKGLGKGTLVGDDRPMRLDDYDWDVLPALLAEAGRRLKVAKVENRYLMALPRSTAFDLPAGISVYLSDEYGGGGYLRADTRGKVNTVVPAEG
ncbi:serine/threonine-protein kinase [Streptomyces fructofermentans]|uniref:non-specific serine/threonine protein kinase n=1 Tax=Streptomyces fructofermentans TaxID=152141 RepID=A0A918U2M0_9ACTN|nr:serine/threonine-protein kinase [Streptomyces fructofermentans]GGX84825.1 hypothetical protein GCM10010515_60300 [Streptomyces fructofermentans]